MENGQSASGNQTAGSKSRKEEQKNAQGPEGNQRNAQGAERRNSQDVAGQGQMQGFDGARVPMQQPMPNQNMPDAQMMDNQAQLKRGDSRIQQSMFAPPQQQMMGMQGRQVMHFPAGPIDPAIMAQGGPAAFPGQMPGPDQNLQAMQQQQQMNTGRQPGVSRNYRQMELSSQYLSKRNFNDFANQIHVNQMLGTHSNFSQLHKDLKRSYQFLKDTSRRLPGSRELRKDEPPKEVSHQDFLLMEMQDLALDVHEEAYYKRYMAGRLAYEAQAAVLKKLKPPTIIESPVQSESIHPLREEVIDDVPEPEAPIQPIEMSQDNLFNDFPVGPPDGGLTFDDFLNDPQSQLPAPSLQSSARLTPLGLSGAQASQPDRFPSIGPIPSAEPRQINIADESFENVNLAAEEIKEAANGNIEDTFQSPQQSTILPGHAGDVLKTQEQIMENLGDVQKRNQELDKLFQDTKIESKHFAYDASRNQSMADPDLIQINAEQFEKINDKAAKTKNDNLYQNSVVNLCHSFYESKYKELDQRRKTAETQYEMDQFKKYMHKQKIEISRDERKDPLQEARPPQPDHMTDSRPPPMPEIPIEGFFRQDGLDVPPVVRDGNTSLPNQRNDPADDDFMPRQQRDPGRYQPNQPVSNGFRDGQEAQKKDQPAPVSQLQSADAQRLPLFEEDQVEIAFHQDVFQFFEDNHGDTRSQSANIEEPRNSQAPARDEEASELSNEDDVAMREELKPLNANATLLQGFYRKEGEHFLRDVCSSIDRELIRCLPNLTQQEHTELLLDIFQRRPHLNNISDLVDGVVRKHKELVIQEATSDGRAENDIHAMRATIQNDEREMWRQHATYCNVIRSKQAQDFSITFKNVYQTSKHALKEINRNISEKNRQRRINSQREAIPNLSDQEVAFLRWYVSIFGDNWRLIANVLNYHPLTRGYLRTKEFLQESFIQYINSATRTVLINDQVQIKPWRTTGLPLLITERPPSLFCSIKQVNQMHLTKIRSLDIERTKPKRKRVLQIAWDKDGKDINVELKEIQKVQRESTKLVELGRRDKPADQIEEAKDDKNKIVDFALLPSEEQAYIQKFYLGQNIDELLEGDLKRPPPNFNFQSCHNRRRAVSRLKVQSMLKRQRVNQVEEQDKFPPSGGKGMGKGGKVSVHSMVQTNQQVQQKSLGPEISEEELNTPMFCALYQSRGQWPIPGRNPRLVSHQAGVIFWLGYLYKKISQYKCEVKIKEQNSADQRDNAAQHQRSFLRNIYNLHLKEARKIRLHQERRRRPGDPRRDVVENEEKRKRTLRADLETYRPETSLGLRIADHRPHLDQAQNNENRRYDYEETVVDIWDNHESIFTFNPRRTNEYLESDKVNASLEERRLDSIIEAMKMKWDRMDRFWFQKNRHLDLKVKKKHENQQQQQQQRRFQPPAHGMNMQNPQQRADGQMRNQAAAQGDATAPGTSEARSSADNRSESLGIPANSSEASLMLVPEQNEEGDRL